MIDKSYVPVAIRSPFRSDKTHIDWADGHTGFYPHDVLRGYCPCAGCQGHSGTIKFIEGGSTQIRNLEPVGDYGLSVEWEDGHSTGIYTFRYLRALCQCASCVHADEAQERGPRARM